MNLHTADIVYMHGKGWVSLPGLAPDVCLVGSKEHPLDDLDHGVVLTLRAEAIKDDIVYAARVNAQLLGRDRHFRVVEGAGNGSLDRGDVAAVGERQLDGEIAGQRHKEHVHQLGSGEVGLKVGHRSHGRFSSLVARIKAVFWRAVE